jgi:beta-lactam-binding protein with PASTA domain
MRNVRILIAVIAAFLIVVPAALAQVKPPQPVPVPNVAGMPLNTAQKALVSAGFNAVVTQENVTDPNKNNIVLKQQIPPGSTLAKGSNVPVVVGKYTAPAQQPVPNVVGMPLAEAQAALSKAKLNAAVTMQPVDQPQRNGMVMGQKIAVGTPVAPGSMVPVIVGKYTPPARVNVPNVTGKPLAEAQKALAANKLNAEVTMQPVAEPQRNGMVLGQKIMVGTPVAPGSMVPVVVGKYTAPATMPVPNVTGKPLAEAQKILAANKLNAVVTPERVTDKGKGNIVLKQQIAPGTALAPGSQVPLVVGRYEEPVAVPNVVGMSPAQAQSALIRAKLNPSFSYRTVNDTQRNNRVLDQNVRAGTAVAPGSPVNVVVGRFKTTAETVREIQDRQHSNLNQPIPPDSK